MAGRRPWLTTAKRSRKSIAAGPRIGKNTHLDILDAGCGTGLCADVLRPYAKSLVGVDLSPQMLALAAKQQIYDQLVAK